MNEKFSLLTNRLRSIGDSISHRFRAGIKFVKRYLLVYPERSFFITLLITFLLILIGSVTRKPPAVPEQTPSPTAVRLYGIGSAPTVTVSAKVEKSGVVKLIAQSAGVVQEIYRTPGQTVMQNQTVLWLSTNYQGGTAPTIARKIAQENYQFVKDNYDVQKDLIGKQREIAEKLNDQAGDLRDISAQSLDDTRNLIGLNEQILGMIDQQLNALAADPATATNSSLILQVRQGRAGVMSGLNSLRSALRSAEYQSGSENAPAELSGLQKDLALKQLELQEKSLDLNREVSRLNLLVSQITEALMYPASPVSGIVDRVYVQPGQYVNPGTVLASIVGNSQTATAVVTLTRELASRISTFEPSTLYLGSHSVDVYPGHISSDATDGTLNTILFPIPDEYLMSINSGSAIRISIPIGESGTNSVVPYVPLDSVYQTENDAYLYVASPSTEMAFTAASRRIELGDVYGRYVEVLSGLESGDRVILDRTVLDREPVTFDQ